MNVNCWVAKIFALTLNPSPKFGRGTLNPAPLLPNLGEGVGGCSLLPEGWARIGGVEPNLQEVYYSRKPVAGVARTLFPWGDVNRYVSSDVRSCLQM